MCKSVRNSGLDQTNLPPILNHASSVATHTPHAPTQVQDPTILTHSPTLPRFYNLQVVKAKRAIASGKKAKKVEGSDSDDDPLDGPGGSEDDVDMDAFLDAEEDGTGGDEKFGEPDIGHSYDDLADAMLAGRDVAGSDSDAEEDEGAEGDAEDSDSLDGMNVNDLPSASEEGEEQQAGSSKRRNVPAARKDVSSDEEGADSSDGEEEGEDVEGGTSDDDEDDMGLYSDG